MSNSLNSAARTRGGIEQVNEVCRSFKDAEAERQYPMLPRSAYLAKGPAVQVF
jgi:hypothetical protein